MRVFPSLSEVYEAALIPSDRFRCNLEEDHAAPESGPRAPQSEPAHYVFHDDEDMETARTRPLRHL
jgi:hypothetical protein